MGKFAIKGFGGEVPRKDPRELPDNMAEQAVNVDLASGPLDGLRTPVRIIDLSAAASVVQRAYRIPNPTVGGQDTWLPLPSPFSSVVRSPLTNDTQSRVYWTNPNDGAYWNTFKRIFDGNVGLNRPYNLGMIYPDPTVGPTVAAVGGTVGVPLVARSYVYTYMDSFGQESAPSAPSPVKSGLPDAVWTVSGLPMALPANPIGKNYPALTGFWIYRTIVGVTSGANFYRVAFIPLPAGGPTYVDTTLDTSIVGNLTLISASWANPPAGLDGLTSMPGGMLVGFTGNTLHFCEPNRPHTWPAGYDASVAYPIVALAVWQQSLMVLTQGFPSSGTGSTPANFTLSTVQVPEPCIARGSVVVDLMGVYYASSNGLIMLNYFGMQNQTLVNFTRSDWNVDYKAGNVIACRHRAQYLALNTDGTGTGFILDYTEARMGAVKLSNLAQATCIWNDAYTGDTYICSSKAIYLWDNPGSAPLPWRWRSKQFFLAMPENFGACHVQLTEDVYNVAPNPLTLIPLSNNDPSLTLPPGINAQFRWWIGPAQHRVPFVHNMTKREEIFRLPSGIKDHTVQFEIVARVGVHSVEIATTMMELKSV